MKKTALVTGGSGGIGSEICRVLAEGGWQVAVCYKNGRAPAGTLVSELKERGLCAEVFYCDIGDKDSIDKCVAEVRDSLGFVTLLVNNAGTADIELFTDMTDEKLCEMMNVNLLGAMRMSILDEVLKYLPEENEEDDDDDSIKVAVIGKPNVGKSSIINKICGEERVIVSNIAGTTRDATDSVVENEKGKFVFIDTAGIRRKSKVLETIEKYSVLRAYMAVDRADVAVIVIDATVGFTEQDSKVAGYAHEKGKACVVAVNKWDAIEKETNTMNDFQKKLQDDFSFMSYVPFVFISAKTGLRMDKLFDTIKFVAEQNSIRIPTGRLNDVLAYATQRVQPPSDKGRRLKIYYMTQVSTKPPTFVFFVNRADLYHFSYQRYIENQIRETFGLEGTPIVFKIRERDKDDVK